MDRYIFSKSPYTWVVRLLLMKRGEERLDRRTRHPRQQASVQLVWQLARLRYNYRSIPVCAYLILLARIVNLAAS